MYIKNCLFYKDKYNDINDLILSLVDKKFFEIEFSFEDFINHILSDKKNDGDNICFILLDEIGKTIITYRKIDEIKNLLEIIIKKIFSSKKII
jgi:3-dehydroquinate synthetase